MNTRKRLWLTLVGAVLAMTVIACSCNSLLPLVATPTTQPNIVPPNPVSTRTATSQTGNTTSLTSLPYIDDFSDPNSGWDIYSSDHVDEGYRDGYYFLGSKTTEYTEDAYANGYFADTVIEVDMTPVSGIGTKDFDYGLSCRVQSNYDGYDFLITTDGYFAVFLVTDDGGTSTTLLQGDKYQTSSAINPGYETNHVKVTCDGSQLKFEVNGTVLWEGQDSTYSEGDIRFSTSIYEDTPNEIHFDNLAITAP